jgi:alpha-galactosidase
VNTERFPNGLEPLADYVRSLGMGFGLWFEPERVTPGTWLYDKHPEWLLGRDGELDRLQQRVGRRARLRLRRRSPVAEGEEADAFHRGGQVVGCVRRNESRP